MFGISCAYLVPHDRISPVTDLFDTARPDWPKTKGDWPLLAMHVGLGLLALALSMVKVKDEVFAVFMMILVLPVIQPYRFSGTDLHRRVALPMLGTFFLITGLVLA